MTSAVQDRRERIEALGWTPHDAAREDVRRCNLCDGERLVEVARTDRYGFDQRTVLCARCGLGFLAPRLFAAGLICRPDDRGDSIIQLAPTLISGQQEFDEIERILRQVLTEAESVLA